MSITDQLKCKNHPSEFITNYCIKCNHSIDLETCNMELCATCICEHTEFHNRSNTKPEYENIKETHNKTMDALTKYKESLNKEKNKIKNVIEGVEKKRKEIQKIFKKAKDDVIKIVERTFSDIEKEYDDQLQREKQKTGLLNENRLDELHSEINRRCLEVFTVSQELNSLKHCNIQKINGEFLPMGYEFREEVAQEIATNELFQPNLSYKSTHLEEVSGAIKRLMTVSISYPISGDFRPIKRQVSTSKTPTKDNRCIYTDAFSRTSPLMGRSPMNNTNGARQSYISPRKCDARNVRQSELRSNFKENNFNSMTHDQNNRFFKQTF